MESLMVKVIQQMQNTEVGDSQKEIDITLKKSIPESSSEHKNASIDTKSSRASSFSMFRDNVLQYVEDGGWNPQALQTTCICTNSQERKDTTKTSSKLEQVVSSQKRRSVSVLSTRSSDQQPPLIGRSHERECPVTTQSKRDELHPLPLSQAEHNSGKCPNHKSHCPDASHSGNCKNYCDNKNFTDIHNQQCADDVLSSPTSSSDYLTSLESIFACSEKLSPVESTNTDKKCIPFDCVDGRAEESISENGADLIDSDKSSLQVSGTDPSESEGLSTYTLHNRWQEILPKEVVQQISRDNESNKKYLLYHVNKENTLTDSTQYFAELSDGDADSLVLRSLSYQNNECISEFCWSTGSISVEESVEDNESSFNAEESASVAMTSLSFTDSRNSCDSVETNSVDEISQKSNSIQDAYRSILKTITNVNDSTTLPYLGRKSRRSRKVKKKPQIQPVYICPKCQSKYLVSSKKAIAISKCLKCELWTSVNNGETEEEEEDEVSVSFCCLT